MALVTCTMVADPRWRRMAAGSISYLLGTSGRRQKASEYLFIVWSFVFGTDLDLSSSLLAFI